MTNSENNNRIAKNTALLYLRMLISMLVSLYTSRIVLNTLGFENFGIYNVIGGVVVMFTFLNEAMISSTQRFLNFELGKKNYEKVGQVFSTSMTIHIGIAFVILFFAETIGLWFVNYKLNIPLNRINAANWVYQLSILGTLISVIRVPYNAAIIAYERMSFYAYLSILEVLLRLILVLLLTIGKFDKLILYAILVDVVVIIVLFAYKFYCNRNLKICNYRPKRDIKLFKELSAFSGWSLLGGLSNMGASQGVNILINIFFGVTVNAAVGIANNINAVIFQFVSNFQTAFNPQIVKSYASGNNEYFYSLIIRGSKFSFFLLLGISLPILLNTDFILKLWLGSIPEYTVIFTQLTILTLLVDAINGPLWISAQATGKIRVYQITVSTIIMLNLPTAYFFLKMGFNPQTVVVISIISKLILTFYRVLFLNGQIKFFANKFLSNVILPIILVLFFCIPIPYVLAKIYFKNADWISFLSISLISIITSISAIYYLGLTKSEKALVMTFIKKMTF